MAEKEQRGVDPALANAYRFPDGGRLSEEEIADRLERKELDVEPLPKEVAERVKERIWAVLKEHMNAERDTHYYEQRIQYYQAGIPPQRPTSDLMRIIQQYADHPPQYDDADVYVLAVLAELYTRGMVQ